MDMPNRIKSCKERRGHQSSRCRTDVVELCVLEFGDAILLAQYQGTRYWKSTSENRLLLEHKQNLRAKKAMLSLGIDMCFMGQKIRCLRR